MSVRGTDLIAVVDNEVRIASLVDVKASASNQSIVPSCSSSTKLPSSCSYKVLVPGQGIKIGFDIRSLSINPTGKLLACVGDSQITLMVLPRSGYMKHVDREIVCRTVPIAPYYHSAHSETSVAKVDWHPWGENGTSLLVLTEDGLLREYDVAKDTAEPQQTASFVPVQARSVIQRSRSRSATPGLASHPDAFSAGHGIRSFGLSAEDDDATTAVSFTLCVANTPSPRSTSFDQEADRTWAEEATRSNSPADWSPLTMFGLMKNGDVWALCPFIPKSATVPAAYIHNLAKLASYRANTIESQQTSHVDTQLRYVNSLLKQASKDSANHVGERSRSVTPAPERMTQSRSTSAMNLDELTDSPRASAQLEQAAQGIEQVQNGPVRLHPPSWSYRQDISQGGSAKKAPRPQGPFLLKPAPVELCDQRESMACDLVWTWLTDESSSAESSAAVTGLGALSIVGHDGRVDVALLFESVEAAWDAPSSKYRPAARRQSKSRKTNRYGLSDTEDEADELQALTLEDRDTLPCLLVYETIDLGMLDTALDNGVSSHSAASDLLRGKMSCNKPCFVRDPLYGDTIYVYHVFGAQCLGFATWVPKLLQALNLPSQDQLDNTAGDETSVVQSESREQALAKMLHYGYNTEVVWIVNTVAPESGTGLDMNPVTAVSILSDVYLSYAFLGLTADLQLVGVELSLRVDLDALDLAATREASLTVGATDTIDGQKPYVSLLGDGPAFQPPRMFALSAGVQGLPQHPRRAALSGTSTKSELEITPDLLRALGKTVETYRHEIRDVVSAGNAVQARLDLQVREMTRQLDKLNSIRLRCQDLGSKGMLGERVAKIAATQLQLVARIDRALQRLMDSHEPSLSMYEKKWFQELERIADEVGISRTDARAFKVDTKSNRKSLSAKAELLSHQLSLLRPQMAALHAQDGPQQHGLLGGEQLKKVEKLLSNQAAMLAEAKQKVSQLNKQIAQIKPTRDAAPFALANQDPLDADSSVSFSNTTAKFGGGQGGLPTSSTAASFADLSRSSPFRGTHSRTGSSFFA